LPDASIDVNTVAAVILLLICGGLLAGFLIGARRSRREQFIRAYQLRPSLLAELSKSHPLLTEQDQLRVAQALRDFFLVRLHAGEQIQGGQSFVN
jgi:hypothetical protein